MAAQRFLTRVGGKNQLQRVDVGLSTGIASTALVGHTAVAYNADGLLIPADCTVFTSLGCLVGVIENSYSIGSQVEIRVSGNIDNPNWSWIPNAPIFFGQEGTFVQTLPVGAKYSQVIGVALSPTKMFVSLQPAIVLA